MLCVVCCVSATGVVTCLRVEFVVWMILPSARGDRCTFSGHLSPCRREGVHKQLVVYYVALRETMGYRHRRRPSSVASLGSR